MLNSLQLPLDRPFLDVPAVIESSRPKPRGRSVWFFLGLGITIAVLAAGPADGESGRTFVLLLTGAGLVATVWLRARFSMGRLQEQSATLDGIEEMIELRRWDPAGMLLDRFLAEPAFSPQLWARALTLLGSLLDRHHRYADAVTVHDFLLDQQMLTDLGDYSVRVSRAMEMLHDDRLVDADRAIIDIRRRVQTGRAAGLTLVEMYRDVKTGHPVEAIELCDSRREVLRTQLGHRQSDAYLMSAAALDRLGRIDEAADAVAKATLLAPAAELVRRYPELKPVLDKYPATPAPAEAA